MKHFKLLMKDSSGEFYLDIFADSEEEAKAIVTTDGYDAKFISATLVWDGNNVL